MGLLCVRACTSRGLALCTGLLCARACTSRGLALAVVVASPAAEQGLQGAPLQQWPQSGLVALQPVGSSQSRDRTHVSCIGGWTLSHRSAREVPRVFYTLFSMECVACVTTNSSGSESHEKGTVPTVTSKSSHSHSLPHGQGCRGRRLSWVTGR